MMSQISQMVQSPVGPLKITVEDGFVTGLEFSEGTSKTQKLDVPYETNLGDRTAVRTGKKDEDNLKVLNQAIHELDAYFAGRLHRFTVPVRFSGTHFQQTVWQAMQEISYGETKTYGELAGAAGSPKAARAVGNACAANPVTIIVPCHRVLAQNGLGGFGGGIDTKRWLLDLERTNAD